MNQIKEVYSRVTADDSAVDAAIIKAKEQKITRISAGKITAIAAVFVAAVIAVGAIVFILQAKSVSMSSESYREADEGAAYEVAEEEAADEGYVNSVAVVSGVDVASAISSEEELTVVYFISKDSGYAPGQLALAVEYGEGSRISKLDDATVADGSGGWYITSHFEAIQSQEIVCKFYDGETFIGKATVTVSQQ